MRAGSGFGCVHPWPELGDAPLDECLEDFAGGRSLPLVRRTWACVEADGGAREAGRSLFEGLRVPPSHATLGGLDEAGVEAAVARGFTHVKVKAGRDVVRELAILRDFLRKWPELRWRVDFNESGCLEELSEGFQRWSEEERRAVDYLEDALPFFGRGAAGEGWDELRKETGFALANDRWVEADGGRSEVLVVKPAVNEMIVDDRVVVTSYLDHPLGQVFAAWEAARAGVKRVCGLQTHGVFQDDEFTEVLGEVGPDFVLPEGVGLGFGDLLEDLDWVRL